MVLLLSSTFPLVLLTMLWLGVELKNVLGVEQCTYTAVGSGIEGVRWRWSEDKVGRRAGYDGESVQFR